MGKLNPRPPTDDDLRSRLKRLHLSRRFVLDLLAGRVALDYDLPADTAIVEVHNGPETQGFMLILWSASFDPVEPGIQIPEIPSAGIVRYL